jgi:hypothetical protein
VFLAQLLREDHHELKASGHQRSLGEPNAQTSDEPNPGTSSRVDVPVFELVFKQVRDVAIGNLGGIHGHLASKLERCLLRFRQVRMVASKGTQPSLVEARPPQVRLGNIGSKAPILITLGMQ